MSQDLCSDRSGNKGVSVWYRQHIPAFRSARRGSSLLYGPIQLSHCHYSTRTLRFQACRSIEAFGGVVSAEARLGGRWRGMKRKTGSAGWEWRLPLCAPARASRLRYPQHRNSNDAKLHTNYSLDPMLQNTNLFHLSNPPTSNSSSNLAALTAPYIIHEICFLFTCGKIAAFLGTMGLLTAISLTSRVCGLMNV